MLFNNLKYDNLNNRIFYIFVHIFDEISIIAYILYYNYIILILIT